MSSAPMLWCYLLLPLALAVASIPLMSASSSNVQQQQFVVEPHNQTAVVGTKAILPCRVKNLSGFLQWVRDWFGLGDLSGWKRFRMRGGGGEGDYSLEIDPVTLEDEADYECQVIGGNPRTLRSRPARLTVLVPPEAPKIVQGSFFETVEESDIALECVSTGGKPAARISWIVVDRGVLNQGVNHSVERINGSNLYTSRSVLKLTAKKHHHKTTFVCRVQHAAEQFARSTGIQLQVRFAPRVTVSVVGKNRFDWIVEDSDIRVVCHVDANPSIVSYKWFIDGRESHDSRSELVFRNVSRSLQGVSVLCQAYNELGRNEDSVKLNISYGPHFRLQPLPVYSANNGSTVTMTCVADGRPAPDIKWLFIRTGSNHETVVGTSPNLTLNVVTNNTGLYYCKVRVVGFPEITSKSAQLLVNGKPEIFSIRSQLAPSGEVLVECEAISLPKYDKVTWSRNGKKLAIGVDYDIKERDLFPAGIKSVLTIKGAPGSITGMFSCSVANACGTDSVQIYLIPPKAEAFPFFAVLGVTGGCVVFVGVTVGVMLSRKCRTHSAEAFKSLPVGDSEGDRLCRQTSDLSSNVSVVKMNSCEGSFMSQPMSDANSEQVIEVLPPVKSVLTDNHIKYATGDRVSTFSPQSVHQQDDRNSTYVCYDQVSQDDIPSYRTKEMPNVCHPGTIVRAPDDSSTPLDVNVWLPSTRCSSATTTDSRHVPPLSYRTPCRRCSIESMQSPPSHTSLAVGPRSTPFAPTPPPSPHPLLNTAANEAALQVGLVPNSSTTQGGVPPSQTDTLRRGVVASVV